MVCSAPAPSKHIVPFKHFRKTSAKNEINSPEGQTYFTCKTVEAAIVHLDYSYESNLGKILGLFLCLKLDVYCLLAVTFVAEVKCGQEVTKSPLKKGLVPVQPVQNSRSSFGVLFGMPPCGHSCYTLSVLHAPGYPGANSGGVFLYQNTVSVTKDCFCWRFLHNSI